MMRRLEMACKRCKWAILSASWGVACQSCWVVSLLPVALLELDCDWLPGWLAGRTAGFFVSLSVDTWSVELDWSL